jgi:hypothetical protein
MAATAGERDVIGERLPSANWNPPSGVTWYDRPTPTTTRPARSGMPLTTGGRR